MSFLRVGLTGGIACGKSVVRDRFASRGVATLDADRVVHELFASGTSVTEEVSRAFGADVLRVDGSVDRKRLGSIVFASTERRRELEAIVHPAVWRRIESFFEEAERRGDELAVVDAALMVETGSYQRYDLVVVVFCEPEVQRQRLMDRDNLSREEAEKRIGAQLPAAEKAAVADHVIDSSGTIAETRQRADEVLAKLLVEARK